jgi:hypothetical protein
LRILIFLVFEADRGPVFASRLKLGWTHSIAKYIFETFFEVKIFDKKKSSLKFDYKIMIIIYMYIFYDFENLNILSIFLKKATLSFHSGIKKRAFSEVHVDKLTDISV